jgi:polysaccharide biosynthesis/export protein
MSRVKVIFRCALALFALGLLGGAVAAAEDLPGPVTAAPPAPAVAAPPPAAAGPATVVPDNVIRPGDQVSIQVYGDPSLTQTLTVAADGKIDYPLVGQIPIAGKTPEQAHDVLVTALQQYLKHPRVTVSVVQPGLMNVLVLGDVKVPGRYQIRSGGHLTDAIAVAGGLGPTNGDLPVVRVTGSDGSNREASLQRLLHDGDAKLNYPLENNSIVYVVGPNTFTIEVVGAVDRPGSVDLNEGDRLSMAIARAGTSPTVWSDLNHVVVTRTGPDGKAVSHEINMYNALKQGDMAYDPVLKKGDIVYVPQGRKPISDGGFSPGTLILHFLGLGF